jgi:group II intron reverse transcriptase/maturase
MTTRLQRIVDKARSNKKLCFNNLAHHLSSEALREGIKALPKRTGSGCDGMTRDEALETFEKWAPNVLSDIHNRGYVPPPVKRVWIPKPGKAEKRPIGVPTVIDRAVQGAVAKILSQIYEQDFLPSSFGGRPKLGAHHAVCTLKHVIQSKKVAWVLECDLKNFFGSLDHGWVERFLLHRVADPRIVSLVRRWLKAGVLEEGNLTSVEIGTPQGGSISVLLSNIYLHYVLDLWFEKRVKKGCKGEAHLVRYIDDFVICCEYKSDATRIQRQLEVRLQEFCLSLEPSKTKLLRFGRFARRDSSQGSKPATFSFLGFTFCCSLSAEKRYLVQLRTEKKRLNRTLIQLRLEMERIRHFSLKEQRLILNAKIRGHYCYFGLGGNVDGLLKVYRYCYKQWRRVLLTRSQNSNLTWSKYAKLIEHFPLDKPKLVLTYQQMPSMVRL